MSDELFYLRSPQAVRERSTLLFHEAQKGNLLHWDLHLDKMPEVVALVDQETKANYPDGKVPYHSRLRHFDPSRQSQLSQYLEGKSAEDKLILMTGLVIISVLLDAGAGMTWRYQDPVTNEAVGKSEGLARASFDWYMAGGLSSDGKSPRADRDKLLSVTEEELRQAFQVTSNNPLVGIEGRLSLLKSLGACLRDKPAAFAMTDNLGAFGKTLVDTDDRSATQVLRKILATFADIWPGRHEWDGHNLGDVWKHPLLGKTPQAAGFIPFHKLSQWLAYSLIETCELNGFEVSDIDQLTGLPEYRNGGLFYDTGVIQLKNPEDAKGVWSASDPLIVEWRALTVALLDVTAAELRKVRQVTEKELPLACVLQGGTWSVGRKLAAKARADGGSPLQIKSDGTVF